MRRIILPLVTVALLLSLAACGDDPVADQVAGSYGCTVTEYTQYQKNGQWRDTAYVFKNDGMATITKVDDQTVSVSLKSERFGNGTFDKVTLRDYNATANLSGKGSFDIAGEGTYGNCSLSGTFGYDTRAVAISMSAIGHSPKFILSFTNKQQ